MRQKCNIPWNSNEEMNDCMDNDEKRAHLVTYFSSKKYKDRKHAYNFMAECFTDEFHLQVHTIE